ncbi:MAG TPA: hypothetical protein VGQ27_07015 [Steroidobacteraceae bacterium]|jgi:hypothetical protein|nr:hypothetical protein [Steroidobacteraceae bacterium]
MKTITSLVAAALLGAASLAAAQVNAPNPQAPGMSIQSAIRLDATSDLMVDRAIKRWLHSHYPGWDSEPHEFMNIGPDRYAVVYISSANNPARRLYFRISNGTMEDEDGAMSMPHL